MARGARAGDRGVKRESPFEMTPEEFRDVGHRLVDRIAEFLATLPARAVTPGETPEQVRSLLGADRLPEKGRAPGALLERAAGMYGGKG